MKQVETVVIMKSSQVGCTEAICNIIGYYIHQDPSPILDIEPDEPAARDFSIRRVAPMVRDTPILTEKIGAPKTRDTNNTIFEKRYPGGLLAIGWATSPSQLASRPIRIITGNDIDRYPPSAGKEGDPLGLAIKRTRTFWNRKIFVNSSPTTRGLSKIEELFFLSNQQHFYVPCPYCRFFQKLIFYHRSQFASLAKGMLVYTWDGSHITYVAYRCGNCQKDIPETEKYKMLREGEWRALRPDIVKHQGFHINELYSPWSSWAEIAEGFENSKHRVELLRIWVNTTIGETFDESESPLISGHKLLDRREDYTKIPEGVVFLTATVDVQDDRLECYVEGWGEDEESWLIDFYVAEGSPAEKVSWKLMEDYLLSKKWEHGNGYTAGYGELGGLMAVGVDTGYYTKEVYKFVKAHKRLRFFALKGKGGMGVPIISETKSKKLPVRLQIVGTDDAKQRIYDRLQQEKKGPGYQHFNKRVGKDYFDQLLSEHRVVKLIKGRKVLQWELIEKNRRNEALDCKVYNLAIYHKLNPVMSELKKTLQERMVQAGKEVKTIQSHMPEQSVNNHEKINDEQSKPGEATPRTRKRGRRLTIRMRL